MSHSRRGGNALLGPLGRAGARILSRSDLAFRLARRIVNTHEGTNDDDIRTNGELQLARALVPRCRVVFDVGANIGDWTAMALAINGTARYHCFEPSEAAYRRLASRGLPPNVRLNPFGLGAANESRSMFDFAEAGRVNSLYSRIGTDSAPLREERVAIRVLDDYCRDEGVAAIDFVKIDVEGHELAVLQGASGMLGAGRVGVVQFEYGGTYIDSRVLLKDVWDLVRSVNREYVFYKLYPDGPRVLPEYRQAVENFQYSNWVFTRPDWAAALGRRVART